MSSPIGHTDNQPRDGQQRVKVNIPAENYELYMTEMIGSACNLVIPNEMERIMNFIHLRKRQMENDAEFEETKQLLISIRKAMQDTTQSKMTYELYNDFLFICFDALCPNCFTDKTSNIPKLKSRSPLERFIEFMKTWTWTGPNDSTEDWIIITKMLFDNRVKIFHANFSTSREIRRMVQFQGLSFTEARQRVGDRVVEATRPDSHVRMFENMRRIMAFLRNDEDDDDEAQ